MTDIQLILQLRKEEDSRVKNGRNSSNGIGANIVRNFLVRAESRQEIVRFWPIPALREGQLWVESDHSRPTAFYPKPSAVVRNLSLSSHVIERAYLLG